MKLSLALGSILLLFSSCLKHDVLKQDADGNFQQSDFYQSGDFQNYYDISIEDLVITQYTGGTGNQFCKPTFNVRLSESYVLQLQQYWDLQIRLTVSEISLGTEDESITTYNLRELLPVEKRKGVECGLEKKFFCKLDLITPKKQIIASVEKEFSIQTP